MVGNCDIVNLFQAQYESLYNSQEISDDSQIEDYIINNIANCSQNKCKFSHKITIKDITEAIKNLKPLKKDFIYGISSDHFINGTCKLKEILSFLFNAFFVHEITNNTINSSIIMPLPKNS